MLHNVITLDDIRGTDNIEIRFCDEFNRRCERRPDGLWNVYLFGHVRNRCWAFQTWFGEVMNDFQIQHLCFYACSPDDEIRVG